VEVAEALKGIGFEGYASAEALPYPDPDSAAAQTITAFRKFLVRKLRAGKDCC